jgi:PAS domain S-box-containing protein
MTLPKRDLRILIVEDSTMDAELIERELRAGGITFQARRVKTEPAFRKALDEFAPDLLVTDYKLPAFSGPRALEIVRQEHPEIPVIFVSGTIGDEVLVELLKQGATDYIIKQRLERLVPAVRRALKEVEQRAERRRVDEQLRKLSRAVEQSPTLIMITDTAGLIDYVNPKFEQVTGYAAEDVIGENPRILKSGRMLPQEFERLWKTITAGDEWHGEFQNRKKSGELYWESASISPIRNAEGKITHYLAVKEDITEKKKLEAQLLRAQRMDSIGALASGIAHDLNNILSPILMAAPLLRGRLPPSAFDTLVTTIETSATRGAEIVRQVLTFGRGVQTERLPVQIRNLIHEIHMIGLETFPKSITLGVSVAKDLWTVLGDATQLHQVLLNLCINARDAMPDGGLLSMHAKNVEVDENFASMAAGARPGRYVMIEVNDTGCGIPADVLDKIFDPFFTTKEIGKGTGLGLSTVAGIVKSHHGFLNVKTRVGKGTTFEAYLPASLSVEQEKSEPRKVLPTGRGELVLLVDDEASIRGVAKAVLESHGYQTLAASDGAEGIATYAQHRGAVSAVVTDSMMPGVDGVALVRALRKMTPDLKIIASTGRGEKTHMGDFKAMRVDAILTKPYTAETLLVTLDGLLHHIESGAGVELLENEAK